MANTKSANDFNRLQAELFYKQTTSTSRKRRNKPSTPTTVTTKTTILWIQARTTESSDDLPSTRTIFPTKITSPTTTTTTTTATPSGQKRTRNSTKLAEFQQKDFKPEIEVEPLSPSGQSETEKGETFRKASFFPDINKNNNAVTIKCSSHNNIVLLILMAIPVVEFQVWGYKIQ